MTLNQPVTLLTYGSKKQGGLEKYTLQIGQAFLKKGCEVTVVSSNASFLNHPQFKVQLITPHGFFAFQQLQNFDASVKRWVHKQPSHLIFGTHRTTVQTHFRAGNGVHASYLRKRASCQTPFKTLYSKWNPLHTTLLKLEKQTFEFPGIQKIFTNSHMVKQEILTHYRADSNKIQVVHNGVEWNHIEPYFINWPTAKADFCTKHNLDPEHLHLLFIGHGYERKGLLQLLQSLAAWSFQDFHLSIVGDDKEKFRYMQLVKQLHLENKVKFFGTQSEIFLFYQMADVLVIPSIYDPFANVTLEALAMGLFVLSSKDNGASEILSSETGCLIEDLFCPDSFLHGLQQALQHKKTKESAVWIRNQVQRFDFSRQLNLLIEQSLHE